MWRFVLVACAVLVLALYLGCTPEQQAPPGTEGNAVTNTTSVPPTEPTEPNLNAPPPGTLVGEEAEVAWAMEAYRTAFLAQDAEACLKLMTPEVQEMVGEWYRSGDAFALHGEAGQKTFEGEQEVEVLTVEGDEAEAAIHAAPGTSLEEWGPLQVLLEKRDGKWLMAEPIVSPPPTKAGI